MDDLINYGSSEYSDGETEKYYSGKFMPGLRKCPDTKFLAPENLSFSADSVSMSKNASQEQFTFYRQSVEAKKQVVRESLNSIFTFSLQKVANKATPAPQKYKFGVKKDSMVVNIACDKISHPLLFEKFPSLPNIRAMTPKPSKIRGLKVFYGRCNSDTQLVCKLKPKITAEKCDKVLKMHAKNNLVRKPKYKPEVGKLTSKVTNILKHVIEVESEANEAILEGENGQFDSWNYKEGADGMQGECFMD